MTCSTDLHPPFSRSLVDPKIQRQSVTISLNFNHHHNNRLLPSPLLCPPFSKDDVSGSALLIRKAASLRRSHHSTDTDRLLDHNRSSTAHRG
ncbi:unnamed protein product [Caenorhabditis nigoni]